MDTITIEEYEGPAVYQTAATHQITVSPDEHSERPELDFMHEDTWFRNEGGPHLKIVAACIDRRKYQGHTLGPTHQIHHVYLAKEGVI